MNLSYDLIKNNLAKTIPKNLVDNIDIVVEIDNQNDDLSIDIDLISFLPPRAAKNQEEKINQALKETFNELDIIVKEKYSA